MRAGKVRLALSEEASNSTGAWLSPWPQSEWIRCGFVEKGDFTCRLCQTQRLERFARALAEGASPFAATVAAGIKTDRADAEQSAKHPKIAARVAELRAIRAQESVTTPDEQFEALEKVRQLAMARRNPSGAISAIEQKAHLLRGNRRQCDDRGAKGTRDQPRSSRQNRKDGSDATASNSGIFLAVHRSWKRWSSISWPVKPLPEEEGCTGLRRPFRPAITAQQF